MTYLAETENALPCALQPLSDELATVARRSSPLRADWAAVGGHRKSLAWVRSVWPSGGEFRARQQRTWNLSSLWHLESDEGGEIGAAWLKQVPPFLAHEAAVLTWLGATLPGVSPRLFASDYAGRMLLEHVAGEDCYAADGDRRARFAEINHEIQLASMPAADTLVASGIPDRRGIQLAQHIRARLSGQVSSLPRVARFLEGLEPYLVRVVECGVPDVLVHGDFHPGNVRQSDSRAAILDWGDSFVGHPAFDLLRLSEGSSPRAAANLLEQWSSRWRRWLRSCEPERAVALLRPLVPLRAAATYAAFVEHIEESEHPFHASDIVEQLTLAERILTETQP